MVLLAYALATKSPVLTYCNLGTRIRKSSMRGPCLSPPNLLVGNPLLRWYCALAIVLRTRYGMSATARGQPTTSYRPAVY
eukprot:1572885-Rhodomonas_salina.3